MDKIKCGTAEQNQERCGTSSAPFFTVYNFYSRAKQKGTWEKVMRFLVMETRIKAGKDAEPSYALIDSQSVKTAYRSDKKGYDGGKKRKE